jgi:hypothetical protein
VADVRVDERVSRRAGDGDPAIAEPRAQNIARLDARAVDRALAASMFVAGFSYLLALRPFQRPLILDPATWDYMSVRIAAGMVPYRDIFLHKTPGAALLGACGAALANLFGLPAVHGAHAAFLVLGAAGAAVLYLLCRRTMPAPLAVAAAAFLFAFDQWPLASVEGVRAQVATVTLGIACLLCAERGRFLASGILGGAATLCWQPALAFLAGALCAVDLGRPRVALRSAATLTAGALLPPILMLACFAAIGAFQPFFAEAVGFNLHYIALQAKTPLRTLAKLATELWRLDAPEMLLLPIALLGVLRARVRPPASLMVAGAIYLAMTFVSFQAWPDTILLGAPLAALLAAGLAGAFSLAVEPFVAFLLVIGIALGAASMPSAARLRPPITFAEQATAMRALAPDLRPNDTVVAVSIPEFLIHTGRTSRWPWPYMWFGVDRFAADHTPGGFEAILADLERDPPALVLIARHWGGPLRRRFTQWLAARYDHSVARIYPHTGRPIMIYRLRTGP